MNLYKLITIFIVLNIVLIGCDIPITEKQNTERCNKRILESYTILVIEQNLTSTQENDMLLTIISLYPVCLANPPLGGSIVDHIKEDL